MSLLGSILVALSVSTLSRHVAAYPSASGAHVPRDDSIAILDPIATPDRGRIVDGTRLVLTLPCPSCESLYKESWGWPTRETALLYDLKIIGNGIFWNVPDEEDAAEDEYPFYPPGSMASILPVSFYPVNLIPNTTSISQYLSASSNSDGNGIQTAHSQLVPAMQEASAVSAAGLNLTKIWVLPYMGAPDDTADGRAAVIYVETLPGSFKRFVWWELLPFDDLESESWPEESIRLTEGISKLMNSNETSADQETQTTQGQTHAQNQTQTHTQNQNQNQNQNKNKNKNHPTLNLGFSIWVWVGLFVVSVLVLGSITALMVWIIIKTIRIIRRRSGQSGDSAKYKMVRFSDTENEEEPQKRGLLGKDDPDDLDEDEESSDEEAQLKRN